MEHKNEILPVAWLFRKTRSFVCENNKWLKIRKSTLDYYKYDD